MVVSVGFVPTNLQKSYSPIDFARVNPEQQQKVFNSEADEFDDPRTDVATTIKAEIRQNGAGTWFLPYAEIDGQSFKGGKHDRIGLNSTTD